MATERVFLMNPYDENHMRMLKGFEQKNNLGNKLSEQLKTIRLSVSQEEYIAQNREMNEIEDNLFIEKDDQIVDMCHLHIEKDIKIGHINLAPIQKKENVKKMISLACDYAFNTCNVKDVFIEVEKEDKALIHYLDSHNYENLGGEKGHIIFLKEKEENRTLRMIV